MRVLNQQYRGVDRTTDVLSFPQIDVSTQLSALSSQHFMLGDIVINIHKAKRQAIENGITFNEELKRLLLHGLLHLLGYDHEDSKYAGRKMQKKTKEILNQL